MLTKEQVDQLVTEQKSLKTRAEAAEAKTRTLEEEKANTIAAGGSWGPNGGRSDSDEQRAMRYFGCSDVKKLINVNVADPQFRMVPDGAKHLVLNLKKVVDIARFTAQMFRGDGLDMIGKTDSEDRIAHCKSILVTNFGKEVLAPALKAFGSTVSGGGDEWVPTLIASSYIPEYELDYVLERRFAQVNMPSNPFDMPKAKNVTKARIATEGVAKTAANFGTDKIRFTAVKLAEYFEIPEELNEDSAPDFLAAGRDEVVRAQVRGAESAIINGDNDGTHIDSDTQAGAADLAEKAWNGLRKLALANSATTSFAGAAVTSAKMKALRSSMGKFGSIPEDMLIVAGPTVYMQIVGLDEVATVDKFGPMATILKGALAAWQGIPVVNSEQFREDLNASGVVDGMTSTLAGLLMVNLKRFYFGQRRPIRVKVMPSLPADDKWLMASYRRADFEGHTQSASEKSVVYGINILK